MQTINKDYEIAAAHFAPEISQKIRDYVTNVVLLRSRYIFTKRIGNFQFSYCTHCKEEYINRDKDLKQNDRVTCTKCGSRCTAKASGMGRKYLSDSAWVVYYEKSIINPQVIVARGMYVERNYSGDYYTIETSYKQTSMYVFENGNSRKFYRSYSNWYQANSVTSDYCIFSNNSNTTLRCSYESIKAAIKGTSFQYSTYEEYLDGDMVKFFGLFCKYPCIEVLTKMGYKYFVSAKLNDGKTFGAVNWKGKTIDQILKITKHQMTELKVAKAAGISVYALTLRLFQISKKDNSNYTLQELQNIVNEYGENFEELKKALKHTTLRRSINYIKQQLSKSPPKHAKKDERYHLSHEVIIAWKDYISDCGKLEMNLKQEDVLFPKDLFSAHQLTMTQVKVQASEIFNAKIAKRVLSLAKYRFENDQFFIRPAESSDELITEGKELKHCVGGYAEDYAKGSTSIFVIRKKSEPDTPFFTMEIQKDRIIQTQGLKHITPQGDVKEFVDAFKAEKLDKQTVKNKTKTQISVAV